MHACDLCHVALYCSAARHFVLIAKQSNPSGAGSAVTVDYWDVRKTKYPLAFAFTNAQVSKRMCSRTWEARAQQEAHPCRRHVHGTGLSRMMSCHQAWMSHPFPPPHTDSLLCWGLCRLAVSISRWLVTPCCRKVHWRQRQSALRCLSASVTVSVKTRRHSWCHGRATRSQGQLCWRWRHWSVSRAFLHRWVHGRSGRSSAALPTQHL